VQRGEDFELAGHETAATTVRDPTQSTAPVIILSRNSHMSALEGKGMRHSIIAAAALLAGTTAVPANAAHDEQLWTTQVVNVKLADKWRVQEELVERFSDARHGLYEIESNTLLGYKLSKAVTLWAGYTHDPQYSAGHFTVMERRFREQVSFDNVAKLGPGKLSFRLRMEQRWRDNAAGTGWRLRPYAKYTLPLARGSKTALIVSSEPFINLNTTPFQKQDGLERVRNLIAISTPLSKKITAEIGYLNQHGFVRGGPDTSDHVASVSLSLSL
jgi:hypothetical protein